MKLIIGLGNPGKEYELTRHNIGFMCVDNYVDNSNWKEKFNSLYQQININNQKVIILKPLTFMNLSGIAVKKFMDFYKISVDDMLVIQDDLDLPVGQIKLKCNSSAGGHNGIKSIIENLGTNSFARLKIGIANDKMYDTKDYVLGKFCSSELEKINESIKNTRDIISCFLQWGIDKTMNMYNKK